MKIISVTGADRYRTTMYVSASEIEAFYCDSVHEIHTVIQLKSGRLIGCTESTTEVKKRLEEGHQRPVDDCTRLREDINHLLGRITNSNYSLDHWFPESLRDILMGTYDQKRPT